MPNLIDTTFATQAMAAAGLTLSAAQTTHLPNAIKSASEAIQRWCGDRDFVRATYDRLLRPNPRGIVWLGQYPVNAITRVAAWPVAALQITNTDSSGNQRATVGVTTTGDWASGLTITGLRLTRVSSGTVVNSDLAFATYTTVAALAAAISALGNGWSATVVSTYSAWPSAELVFEDAVAAGTLNQTVDLNVFGTDLTGVKLRRDSGRLELGLSTVPDVVRVVWDGGFDTVPMPVQQVAAEVVRGIFTRMASDPNLQSESIGDYSYTRAAEETLKTLPTAALQVLSYYRTAKVISSGF